MTEAAAPEPVEHQECRACGARWALSITSPQPPAATKFCEHGVSAGREFGEVARVQTFPDDRVMIIVERRNGTQLAVLLPEHGAEQLRQAIGRGDALAQRWRPA